MKRRDFLRNAAALASVTVLPSSVWALSKGEKLRTAHIGVGGQAGRDLARIASHSQAEVVALCDVDSVALAEAQKLHPNARVFADYRELLKAMGGCCGCWHSRPYTCSRFHDGHGYGETCFL